MYVNDVTLSSNIAMLSRVIIIIIVSNGIGVRNYYNLSAWLLFCLPFLCSSPLPILPGHLKFWKKKAIGIEFAKHFRSHLGPIEGLAVSYSSLLYDCRCMHSECYLWIDHCFWFSIYFMFSYGYAWIICASVFQ